MLLVGYIGSGLTFGFAGIYIYQVEADESIDWTRTEIAAVVTIMIFGMVFGSLLSGVTGARWGRKWTITGQYLIIGATFIPFATIKANFGILMASRFIMAQLFSW